jgi:citrate synthase
MTYMGALTFDSDAPSKFLKIPNLVAAKRFGSALLDQHGLHNSMRDALYTLAKTRNPMDVFIGYCHLMRQHDIIGNAFTKSEEHHRDSIWVAILKNPAIKPMAEYQVRKVRSLLTLRIANVKLTYIVDQ